MITAIRRTYKYQLYHSRKTEYLDAEIELARQIWNHCLALQKRYYRIYGKYVSANRLKVFVTRLRRSKYPEWQDLGSQAVQDVVERLDRSYQAFFDWCKSKTGPRKHPPKFKKYWKYNSFTLKQAGWSINGNTIRIMGKKFRFWLHRPYNGTVKTVTVKRTPYGDYYIVLSVIEDVFLPDVHAGNAVGIDFGLKTFLTLSDGTKIDSPLWLLCGLENVRRANRQLSRKEKGSGNRKRARLHYAKVHEDISNQRNDFLQKLSTTLINENQVICVEDLKIKNMLKNHKLAIHISSVSWSKFFTMLEYKSEWYGRTVVKVPTVYPSSQLCNKCGYKNPLVKNLAIRKWTCPECGEYHNRDINAAMNILTKGLAMIA